MGLAVLRGIYAGSALRSGWEEPSQAAVRRSGGDCPKLEAE